jgi:hypothetical protein
MFKLDDLNPANTFERRLLEFLASGQSLPITIGLDQSVRDRLEALESRPSVTTVPDGSKLAALEAQLLDLMRAVQMLLQAHEDEKRKTHTMRRILIELTDQIDTKLKATGT